MATKKEKARGIGHNQGPSMSAAARKMLAEDKPKATNKQLKQISTLIQEAQGYESELQALGEASTNVREKLNKISNEKLPKAMQEAGTSNFTDMDTGIIVKLEEHMTVKWPTEEEDPANNAKALAFLKEAKAEDLMKCLLEAQFGKKEAKLAEKFFKEILKTGNATVQLTRGVHNATLKKWIGERMKAGKKVPAAVFSINTFTRASIKPPKEKNAD